MIHHIILVYQNVQKHPFIPIVLSQRKEGQNSTIVQMNFLFGVCLAAMGASINSDITMML